SAYTASTPRLLNVSVNKGMGTGLTVGFTITGTGTRNVLIRAIGPTLAAAPFNVAGAATDPQMSPYGANQTFIQSNDSWGTPVGSGAATAAALSTAFTATGAFPLPSGSKDAAILTSLAPGQYTATVTPTAGSTTGTVLVEVYEAP